MMVDFSNLLLGFSVAMTPMNLLNCLFGVAIGTVIGVLPGIGPLATIAMLLPFTFKVPPVGALIMLAGIYYGAQYGGSITSILVNIPGESSSVVTCLDGYAMAQQGRSGPALAIAALGSFFAGCVATAITGTLAPPLAALALEFGPAEYFSLMILGLIGATLLARGSLLKAIVMILLGLLFGLVGTDVTSGARRFTLGLSNLADGIDFVVVAVGFSVSVRLSSRWNMGRSVRHYWEISPASCRRELISRLHGRRWFEARRWDRSSGSCLVGVRC